MQASQSYRWGCRSDITRVGRSASHWQPLADRKQKEYDGTGPGFSNTVFIYLSPNSLEWGGGGGSVIGEDGGMKQFLSGMSSMLRGWSNFITRKYTTGIC